MTYPKFASIPRFNKPVIVTEKLDGTNGQIYISADLANAESVLGLPDPIFILEPEDAVNGHRKGIWAGSRNRWLSVDKDNFNFAQWVETYAERLIDTLGEGSHYGEWWGPGIQRGYGLKEKRFSLFNTSRWDNEYGLLTVSVPGLDVVPVLGIYDGQFISSAVEISMMDLEVKGSVASPGFMRPEGVVVYHTAANQPFKVTFDTPEGKWRA